MANYNIVVRIDPRDAERGGQRVERQLNSMENAADRLRVTMARAVATLTTLAVGYIFSQGIRSAMQFQDALAEVSTLVDTTTFDLARLERQALRNAVAFGSTPVEQTRAFYQAISAGASNAAEAIEILDVANRLAVGGVTDVFTATDGLTTVLNAYGDRVESATAVSDAMFVAMRAGKTTIGELASALGRVAPLAAQTGVSFDELTASIAALTKGGISTDEAVTGVRAILAAVSKPSSEAANLAERLGIQFNTAGLEAKGFQGFLEDLIERTGGSTDQLAILFGGVEALVPVMALAGQAGEDFNAILEDMAEKGGATEEAFNKIANSPGFQARRLWGAITSEVTALATSMAQALVPAMRFLADNMHELVQLAGILAAALLAAFSLQLIGNIAATTRQLVALEMALGASSRSAALLSVTMKGVQGAIRGIMALLAGTIGVLGAVVAAIVLVVSALYVFRDDIKVTGDGVVSLGDVFRAVFSYIMDVVGPVIDWFQEAWATGLENVGGFVGDLLSTIMAVFSAIVDFAKTVVNKQIGLWVGAYQAIVVAWGQFGPAMEAIGVGAINGLIDIVDSGIEAIVRGIGDLLEWMGGAFEAVGLSNPFAGMLDGFETNLEQFKLTASQGAQDVGAAMRNEFVNAFNTDYIGTAIDAVLARAREIAEARAASTGAVSQPGDGPSIPGMPGTPGGPGDAPGAGSAGSGSVSTDFASLLADIEMENQLLRENAYIRGNRNELLELERQLKRPLTELERATADNLLSENERLQAQVDILAELEDPQRELQTRLEAFNALYQQGAINLQEYNNGLMETRLRMAELRIEMGEGTLADGFLTQLSRMTEGVKSFQAQAGTILGNFFTSFIDGFANSVGRAIVYSENLGDALKNVAREALAQLISAFVKLGLQWVTNQIIARTLGAATTAATAAQGAAMASAWAPAAALASLASFGANAGPAIAGITSTMALTQGLALAGSAFADGTPYVSGPGSSKSDSVLAALSVGEGVVTAAANKRNPGIVAAMNAGAQFAYADGTSYVGRSYGPSRAPSGVSSGSSVVSGSAQLNVTVENYSGADISVERLSETDVRIIARQEASAAVRDEAPGVVASDLGRPNGRVSRALAQNTKTQRRRS